MALVIGKISIEGWNQPPTTIMILVMLMENGNWYIDQHGLRSTRESLEMEWKSIGQSCLREHEYRKIYWSTRIIAIALYVLNHIIWIMNNSYVVFISWVCSCTFQPFHFSTLTLTVFQPRDWWCGHCFLVRRLTMGENLPSREDVPVWVAPRGENHHTITRVK